MVLFLCTGEDRGYGTNESRFYEVSVSHEYVVVRDDVLVRTGYAMVASLRLICPKEN